MFRSVYAIAKRLKVCCWVSAGICVPETLWKGFGELRGRGGFDSPARTRSSFSIDRFLSDTSRAGVQSTLPGGWLTPALRLGALCVPGWVLPVLTWGRRTPARPPARHQPQPRRHRPGSRVGRTGGGEAPMGRGWCPCGCARRGCSCSAPARGAGTQPPTSCLSQGAQDARRSLCPDELVAGTPAASTSPFPSGGIRMTGTAGKQNLCLLDDAPAWHRSRDAPAARG